VKKINEGCGGSPAVNVNVEGMEPIKTSALRDGNAKGLMVQDALMEF
jgi:hypothetical protein